jgi:hypothetical protein
MTRRAARYWSRRAVLIALSGTLATGLTACGDDGNDIGRVNPPVTAGLPPHDELQAALRAAQMDENGGLDLNMWATVVDRSGIVVAVAFTGTGEDDQWPGSRVISAQKANTANAFFSPAWRSRPPTCSPPPSRAGASSGSRRATP